MQREKLERFGKATKAKGLANIIVQGKMKRKEEEMFVDNLVKNITRSWAEKSLAEVSQVAKTTWNERRL